MRPRNRHFANANGLMGPTGIDAVGHLHGRRLEADQRDVDARGVRPVHDRDDAKAEEDPGAVPRMYRPRSLYGVELTRARAAVRRRAAVRLRLVDRGATAIQRA
jgi:hypothetical protein